MTTGLFRFFAREGAIAGCLWLLLCVAIAILLLKQVKRPGPAFSVVFLLSALLLLARVLFYQGSGSSTDDPAILLWHMLRVTLQSIIIIAGVTILGVLRYWTQCLRQPPKDLRTSALLCLGALISVLLYESAVVSLIMGGSR